MKMFLIRHCLSVALFSSTLVFCSPAFGQDTTDMLSKALDHVHQVENPSGNTPTDAQRIDLLTQAIKMAQEAPNHRLQGHRVLAIQAIRNAIAEIRSGDPDKKAAAYLRTADTELSISVSLAGGTAPLAGPMASAAQVPKAQTANDFFKQGWAKMHQSDWHGAVAAFDQAIKLDPKRVDAYMERGASKLMLGDQSGGMADYDQAVKIDPKNTETYLKLGEALSMKDPKGAIAEYQQVIALDPKNTRAYEGVATVHWMHQEYDETIVAYDQLIAVDPKNCYAYGCRAMAKSAKGDLDGAIADYGQDILIQPTDFNAFHNRAQAKKKKGDLDGALADLNQAITLGMHDGYVYRERADIRKMLGDLYGALADYDQVVALNAKKDDAFVNLDEIYAGRGAVKLAKRDFDGAIADYNQAIVLKDEDTQQDYFSIWVAQNLQGKKADADALLSSETTKIQGDAWYWPATIAAFLLDQMNESDFMKAATSADAKKDAIQHCQAWYYAGIKHLLAGDKSTAADDFRKSLATNQKDESAYFFAQAEQKAIEKQP
jgi:tetratricopeptide (TPR) repeat protein